MKRVKDFFVIGLIALCIWLWITGERGAGGGGKADTVTVIKVDSFPVYTDVVVYETDTIFLPRAEEKEAPEKEGEDSVSVYIDTVYIDADFELRYAARVTGRLNSISFSLLQKPDTVYNKVITETKTITVEPSGWYMGAGLMMDQQPTFTFGAARIIGKHYIGIDYGLNQSIHLSYKFKLF